jgi:hypothetical protein
LRPTVLANPRSDQEFVDFVHRQVDRQPDADVAAIERRVRQRYPSAAIRERLLASEPMTVWYVYRDGHWTPSA